MTIATVAVATTFAAQAADKDDKPATGDVANVGVGNGTRNGRDIYARFHGGLADPDCSTDASQRWQQHFANAPQQLASRDSDALAMFGYVVDALREAQLPTEYALIPFVESGYRPGARSASGPAGLWQFIGMTARDHHVAMRPGYDGRLSAIDSTQAAVRYLKTLHGMFAGDWRLAVMAYNAGEYRVFDALKRSGQTAAHAQPDKLVGLSSITQAYVRKLHALSCVLDRADDREDWMQALDRPVPALTAVVLPPGAVSLDAWAASQGLDGALLRRLNPAFGDGRIDAGTQNQRVLAPDNDRMHTGTSQPLSNATATLADAGDNSVQDATQPTAAASKATVRTHTVARGDSIWRIAKRYGVDRDALLSRNGLTAKSALHPGMVLKLDADAP